VLIYYGSLQFALEAEKFYEVALFLLYHLVYDLGVVDEKSWRRG